MRNRTTLLAALGALALVAPANLAAAPFALAFPVTIDAPDAPPIAERSSRSDRLREINNLRRDQDRAFELKRRGEAMPLPLLESRIVPRMRGYEYMGPEHLGDRYRFKFVREGRLVWIDVDPRSGRIIGRSGR